MAAKLSEDEVIQFLRHHDQLLRESAWTTCYEAVKPPLMRYVKNRTGRPDYYAEDIVEEAILRGVVNILIGTFQPQSTSSLLRYFYGVARRVIHEEWRLMGKETNLPDSDDHPLYNDSQYLEDGWDDTDELVALYQAFSVLKQEYREVIEMQLQELETQEIAKRLNITESNVHVRSSRGRGQLRDVLKK